MEGNLKTLWIGSPIPRKPYPFKRKIRRVGSDGQKMSRLAAYGREDVK
jgi:hypothetical protein